MSELKVQLETAVVPEVPTEITEVVVDRIVIVPSYNRIRVMATVGDTRVGLLIEDPVEYAQIAEMAGLPALVALLGPQLEAKVHEVV